MTIDEAIKEIKRWTGILMFHGNRCDVETAEAQEMAIKALEELQQYRTLGTPEETGTEKNVRKDTKLTYRELAEYCETRADCSRCKKYELCERLSDYVKENLAPAEVVKMVDSKEKLS